MDQEEVELECPYCGETITVFVDTSEDRQSYVEDCSVCCRPMQLEAFCSGGRVVRVTARRS